MTDKDFVRIDTREYKNIGYDGWYLLGMFGLMALVAFFIVLIIVTK